MRGCKNSTLDPLVLIKFQGVKFVRTLPFESLGVNTTWKKFSNWNKCCSLEISIHQRISGQKKIKIPLKNLSSTTVFCIYCIFD